VAGGVGGVVFALRLATVIDALKIFYTLLGVTLLVPVVGGLYVRRAGSAEALVSMATGIGTLLVVRFGLSATYPWLDPTAAGLVAAAIAFALTYLLRGASKKAAPS
jgi:SSS family solute:Na+ symporter